jgi:hypothetical protein
VQYSSGFTLDESALWARDSRDIKRVCANVH